MNLKPAKNRHFLLCVTGNVNEQKSDIVKGQVGLWLGNIYILYISLHMNAVQHSGCNLCSAVSVRSVRLIAALGGPA